MPLVEGRGGEAAGGGCRRTSTVVEKADGVGDEGGQSDSLGGAVLRVEEDARRKEVGWRRGDGGVVEVTCALADRREVDVRWLECIKQ
jgi:hypothetical protein